MEIVASQATADLKAGFRVARAALKKEVADLGGTVNKYVPDIRDLGLAGEGDQSDEQRKFMQAV